METTMIITVGARSSPLSRAQVLEVLKELHQYRPHIHFENIFIETTGDKDREISLRSLGKTDFFTKEVDQLLLSGRCRIAIHSAKDLPDPLNESFAIAAFTRGLDSSDSLVLREGESIETLPSGAKIATSSEKREEAVKKLRDDLEFIDLRGTIHERLALLENGEADGVVVAEAALQRLGLNDLNRLRLDGETTPMQGRLAILCRKDDQEMINLFSTIHYGNKKQNVLYLGLDLPQNNSPNQSFVHYPIIQIHPRSLKEVEPFFKDLYSYTHFIFTSKTSVYLFFKNLGSLKMDTMFLKHKRFICVGQQTAQALASYGINNPCVALKETAEGITELLEKMPLKNPHFFWPHSALSRAVIKDYFNQKNYRFQDCVLYDTLVNKSLPQIDLDPVDEIHFTSPSTVDAFLELFGTIPAGKKIRTIGSITEEYLVKIDQLAQNAKKCLKI